jgi:hypothetical protein
MITSGHEIIKTTSSDRPTSPLRFVIELRFYIIDISVVQKHTRSIIIKSLAFFLFSSAWIGAGTTGRGHTR